MFAPDMDGQLGLLHSPPKVKAFLKGDFSYYTDLYIKLQKAYRSESKEFPAVYYNAMLDLDAPFLLVLSACVPNDPDENAKVRMIAAEIDRYFSLLQLQSAYDSNEFADSLFRISELIRGKNLEAFRPAFDSQLTATIAARRNVETAEPLGWRIPVGTLNIGHRVCSGDENWVNAKVRVFRP